MLHLLVFTPIVVAIAILLGAPARKSAFVAGTVQFLGALFALFSYDRAKSGFQFISKTLIVPEWDLSFFLAADGLSLLMLLLTGIVTLTAVWVTPRVEKRERLFYSCLLLISAGAAEHLPRRICSSSTPSTSWRSSLPSF